MRGFGDRFTVPLPNGTNVWRADQHQPASPSLPYHLDESKGNAQRAGSTPHSWADTQNAWDARPHVPVAALKSQLAMGYYEDAEVPFQRALADAFTLCDALPLRHAHRHIANRLFYWSGTNGPTGASGPSLNNEVG